MNVQTQASERVTNFQSKYVYHVCPYLYDLKVVCYCFLKRNNKLNIRLHMETENYITISLYRFYNM